MTALKLLPLVPAGPAPTRTTGDRLELLTALMAAPTFEAFLRDDVIDAPPDHPTYGWMCCLEDCGCPREPGYDHCQFHTRQWRQMRDAGQSINDFLRVAEPQKSRAWLRAPACLICPEVPAWAANGLCFLHAQRWSKVTSYRQKKGLGTEGFDFDAWLGQEAPFACFGQCRVGPCPELADNPVGLCRRHLSRYRREGSPGAAQAAFPLSRWWKPGATPTVIPATYGDKARFDEWCRTTPPANRAYGKVSLLCLRPLVKAEIQWTMFRHAHEYAEGGRWPLSWIQHLADDCREQDVNSLADLDLDACRQHPRMIAKKMLDYLRLVYFTREDTKDAGFLETDHFGVRFPESGSHFDLTGVSQRWLRDLLWDHMGNRLLNDPPRSRGGFDHNRRGCLELSAYLEAEAPQGGHDPTLLTKSHMVDFIADQRHRAQHGLLSLGLHSNKRSRDSRPTVVTKGTVSASFNGIRRILRDGMDTGATQSIGLDRGFITVVPYGGSPSGRRNPFPDDVARALAAQENLRGLEALDEDDRGLRDIWEALVLTGRRGSEVSGVRLECIGRLKKIPMFWHDQTKVGNFDEGIRIPEWLYLRIEQRQAKTVARFTQAHGRPPTALERLEIALFPRRTANRHMRKAVSHSWFSNCFREWVDTLDIAHCVPHQARHTLATNLLKAGANLSHVKKYLGQVSEAMAEHYVHIANTDPRLNDALSIVWVGGPGSPEPGMLLSAGEPLTRAQAETLVIDLNRRSTPAEGGFCTYQPVVNGDACPWNLDCHNCDKFVLSGADLVYWRRKAEQWRSVAEGAPDSATADYMHELFEPTARAIAGLEKALDALGLLEEALTLDLRRPQDYFGRVWSTAFRASELARQDEDGEAA
ncbi:hypothetical protein GCM10022403_060610 [Streptomyces coacervatus]|uniref:Tyr recombinase domain-containing protein n=1 Tax=Streptomyces coacervatus TaxID=647381 RepID=A0ABP7IIK8_9ACTN|nr:tyrosine-type recombinase/integrase [Streptomyces coacervatus]MDF2269863.1 tyrosine-type recombinase/integrase [Streptomyces coacervatus]